MDGWNIVVVMKGCYVVCMIDEIILFFCIEWIWLMLEEYIVGEVIDLLCYLLEFMIIWLIIIVLFIIIFILWNLFLGIKVDENIYVVWLGFLGCII